MSYAAKGTECLWTIFISYRQTFLLDVESFGVAGAQENSLSS